jgi:hypothetical protein
MEHPDHRTTGQITLDAVYPSARGVFCAEFYTPTFVDIAPCNGHVAPCRRLGLLGSGTSLLCCRCDESHSPLATKRSLTLLATPVVSGDVAAADAVVPTDYLAFPLLSPQTTWPSPCCLRLASSPTRYAHASLGNGLGERFPCRPAAHFSTCVPPVGRHCRVLIQHSRGLAPHHGVCMDVQVAAVNAA